MTISPDAAPRQRLQLLDQVNHLLGAALVMQNATAEIDYQVNALVGPPWPGEGSGE